MVNYWVFIYTQYERVSENYSFNSVLGRGRKLSGSHTTTAPSRNFPATTLKWTKEFSRQISGDSAGVGLPGECIHAGQLITP